MEHNRRYKIFIIFALVLSIVSVSVGFAAFSSTLSISSQASIKPSSDSFSVVFSAASSSVINGAVSPVISGGNFNATDATINGGPSYLSDIYAEFTQPGQSVTYTLYAINTGEYDAYLNLIEIGIKECNLSDDVSPILGNAACDSIDVSVKVGNSAEIRGCSIEMFSNHILPAGESEKVVVTVSYPSNGAWADGPFGIGFGTIYLEYSSKDLYSGNSNITYSMGDSVKYDPVNDVSCISGDTCYEWNVIEHSDASSNEVTLITTDVMNSLYYEAYSLSADEFIFFGNSQLLDATTMWSVVARHLTETEYTSITDYYGCSWPGWLGMSCTSDSSHDWFYSGDNFFLDGNKWVGYDGGGDGAIHNYSSFGGNIGVRPVITISKDKLV